MTRIDARFAKLKAEGRKAFVAYVMAGDPDYATSLDIVRGLPGAGVRCYRTRRSGETIEVELPE